jgi:hypothetical protein
LSRQIDVMVVHGDGERIPHTDHWIYPVNKVIAVIEVKKSPYKKDLADALGTARRLLAEDRGAEEHPG